MKKTTMYLLLLAWASAGFAQTATQKPAAAPQWRPSQETNAIEAYTYTRYTLVGRFTASASQSADRPALAIDCIPGTGSDRKYLAANLLVGSALKIIYVEPPEIHGTSYFPKVAVKYRANDAKDLEKDNWAPGTDKSSTSVPRDALKTFLRARTVTIDAENDHGSPIEMQFDMPDPGPVSEGCNLNVR